VVGRSFGCCGDSFPEAGFGVIKFFRIGVTVLMAGVVLSGCRSENDDGPPDIRYGDSICAECGMIISDERYATATMVQGDRRIESYVFDDFNCQLIYESEHTDLVIVDRWCHDFESSAWMQTGEAWFVESEDLHTPMASGIVSFKELADAKELSESIGGSVSRYAGLLD